MFLFYVLFEIFLLRAVKHIEFQIAQSISRIDVTCVIFCWHEVILCVCSFFGRKKQASVRGLGATRFVYMHNNNCWLQGEEMERLWGPMNVSFVYGIFVLYSSILDTLFIFAFYFSTKKIYFIFSCFFQFHFNSKYELISLEFSGVCALFNCIVSTTTYLVCCGCGVLYFFARWELIQFHIGSIGKTIINFGSNKMD